MSELKATFYDPAKTFEDNFENGPFPSTDESTIPTINQEYTFLGYHVNFPYGIAAGSLPTSKHTNYAFQKGFDVVCYKTQRSVPFPSNQFPNVVYLDNDGDITPERAKQPFVGHLTTDRALENLTITNSFGNPSRGAEYWVEDLKEAVKGQGEGQLLISSVVGTIKEGATQEDYYDDFAETARIAASTGVKAIEVNLSCPNVANEGVLCYTPEAVITICQKVKAAIGEIPLIAKVGYYTPEQQGILEEILIKTKDYVAVWSAINTLQVSVVDENGNQLLPGENRLKSGACGAGVKWAGLDMVKRLAEFREEHGLNYEIIGIGGVATSEDFDNYRSLGANVVQSVTAAMWNDNLAVEIKTAHL